MRSIHRGSCKTVLPFHLIRRFAPPSPQGEGLRDCAAPQRGRGNPFPGAQRKHARFCAFLAHGESPKPLVSLASCTLQQKWPTPFYYFMTLRFCRKLDFSSRVSLRAVIVRTGIRIAAAPAGTTRTGKVGGLCVSFKFPCPFEERSGTAIRSPGSRDSAVSAHNPSVTASPCHSPCTEEACGVRSSLWLPYNRGTVSRKAD